LVVDDVISAGTSVRESVDIINQANAEAAGVLISLNREEKGRGETSAIEDVEAQFGFKVASIISLSDIIAYLEKTGQVEQLQAILTYQQQYGTR